MTNTPGPRVKTAGAKVILFDLGGVLIENNGRAALTAMLRQPLPASEMWSKWLASPVVRLFERGQSSPHEFASSFVREWEIDLDPAVFISESPANSVRCAFAYSAMWPGV